MQRILKVMQCVVRRRFEVCREPDQPWREAYRELLGPDGRRAAIFPAHAAAPCADAARAASSSAWLAQGA